MQMMDESARLLAFQQQLEQEANGKVKFFGMSINETIRACLLNDLPKRADKIKSDFKVPDKRFVIDPYVSSFHCLLTASHFIGSGTSSYMLSLRLDTLMRWKHLASPNEARLVMSHSCAI